MIGKIVLPVILIAAFSAIVCAHHSPKLSDFCKGDGSPFVKIDNPNAVNVPLDTIVDCLQSGLNEFDFASIPNNCSHYAEAAHNYLESNGIKTAIVVAPIGGGSYHAFIGLSTTDHDRVYINLTDGILAIGEQVNGRYIFTKHYGNTIQKQDVGEERNFLIFW